MKDLTDPGSLSGVVRRAGSVVTVTATYPYEINIPLLGVNLMSGNLTATAKERLE